HIPLGVTVPAQHVARAHPARKGQGEVLLCRGWIRKEVDAAGSLVGAGPGFRRHLTDPGQKPVCRPALATVNAERESAGPASDSGSRPAADDSVQHTMSTACKGATFAQDRKSTRLNSSHLVISYAVFCLKKKKTQPAVTAATATQQQLTSPCLAHRGRPRPVARCRVLLSSVVATRSPPAFSPRPHPLTRL